jgi:hypothetical protein
MQYSIAYPPGLSKFNPLETILCYDDFDRGLNGWVDLKPNYRFDDFEPRKGPLDLSSWGPTMLSTATFAFPGTHGSMDGIYSLKLTTRGSANPYEGKPADGSLGHAIKRLSTHLPKGLLQFEMWYAYTPEQDRSGLGEQDIRAFGFLFDIQDREYRYMPAIRYLNSMNGQLVRRWQYAKAADVSDAEWEYGVEGWCKRGIDPQWFGRRYADGSTDGFRFVPAGEQRLCYNESDDKINWSYFRLLFDLTRREYLQLQSGAQVFDLQGISPTLVAPYANIDGLLNPMIWVEADTDRRVFLYVDSCVISMG